MESGHYYTYAMSNTIGMIFVDWKIVFFFFFHYLGTCYPAQAMPQSNLSDILLI